MIFFANSPLLFRRELFNRWEIPWLSCIVFSKILIGSELHLKVKSALIWLSKIMSLLNEVMELARVSSIIKVNDTWCKVTLPGLSSLENLVKERWAIAFGVN